MMKRLPFLLAAVCALLLASCHTEKTPLPQLGYALDQAWATLDDPSCADSLPAAWDSVTPALEDVTAAEGAQLLYRDAHEWQPAQQVIAVDWGSGQWIKFKTKECYESYFNTDIVETDSSYLVWSFGLYTRCNAGMFNAYVMSEKQEQRLAYGTIYRSEVMKGSQQRRELKGFSVDRKGDVFFEYPADYIDGELHESASLAPAVIAYMEKQ